MAHRYATPAAFKAALEARLKAEALDVTLPLRRAGVETGRIHPISQVFDEITAIFADMGFSIAEGPDIESDDYNFTKLNFPPGHPAREMHDTFFFQPDPATGERKLLRTLRDCIESHLSPDLIEQAVADGLRRGMFTEADLPDGIRRGAA